MKVLIIGGVAGGASAATRLRRLDERAEIIVFERGEYISYANCGLPYYIGNVIQNRDSLLVETPQNFKTQYNIDVRINHEVTKIEPNEKTIQVKNIITGETYIENYDKLVLSPGAKPIVPSIEGIENERIFTLRNIPDTDAIKEFISSHKVQNAMVIGGGFIGLEMVENLHHLGIYVTLVELDKQVFPSMDYSMAGIINQELEKNNVNVLFQTHVVKFEKTQKGVLAYLNNGEKIETEMVIFSIGVRPDIELAKQSGIAIGSLGGIKVNEYLQTSYPDIYAVGDAIEVNNLITNKPILLPLAGPANKQGRIVANNIVLGNQEHFKGVIGNSIAKVFSLTVAKAGLTARQLQKENIDYFSSYTHSMSHAGYYPNPLPMSIKILFSPDTGQVYGVKIVGQDGVDKRIEMIAQVIQYKGTVKDLADLEQAYAPPYSSAKDPVNMAGFVASNILSGNMKIVHKKDIHSDDFILDVRTTKEYNQGHIKNAVNIPLDELRQHLNEIPNDRKIIIHCAGGMRAYFAYRILSQSGYKDIYNLSGGYKTYLFAE
jgi:NADPH-dependent 2,4-dienoyl-CoA reductase/sulfur reductase-like enzyme/rhodanese-related sulfurtransferase